MALDSFNDQSTPGNILPVGQNEQSGSEHVAGMTRRGFLMAFAALGAAACSNLGPGSQRELPRTQGNSHTVWLTDSEELDRFHKSRLRIEASLKELYVLLLKVNPQAYPIGMGTLHSTSISKARKDMEEDILGSSTGDLLYKLSPGVDFEQRFPREWSNPDRMEARMAELLDMNKKGDLNNNLGRRYQEIFSILVRYHIAIFWEGNTRMLIAIDKQKALKWLSRYRQLLWALESATLCQADETKVSVSQSIRVSVCNPTGISAPFAQTGVDGRLKINTRPAQIFTLLRTELENVEKNLSRGPDVYEAGSLILRLVKPF